MNVIKIIYDKIEKESDKAFLLKFETGKSIWLAKSQININKQESYLTIPIWLYPELLQKNCITIKVKI